MKFHLVLFSLLISFAPFSMAESLLWIKGNQSKVPDAVIKSSGEFWLKDNNSEQPDALVKDDELPAQTRSEAQSHIIIYRDNQIWLGGDITQEPDAKLDNTGNVWVRGNHTQVPNASVSENGSIWLISNYTNTPDAAIKGDNVLRNAFIISVYLMI